MLRDVIHFQFKKNPAVHVAYCNQEGMLRISFEYRGERVINNINKLVVENEYFVTSFLKFVICMRTAEKN